MNEPQSNTVKVKKLVTKEYLFYESIFIKVQIEPKPTYGDRY